MGWPHLPVLLEQYCPAGQEISELTTQLPVFGSQTLPLHRSLPQVLGVC